MAILILFYILAKIIKSTYLNQKIELDKKESNRVGMLLAKVTFVMSCFYFGFNSMGLAFLQWGLSFLVLVPLNNQNLIFKLILLIATCGIVILAVLEMGPDVIWKAVRKLPRAQSCNERSEIYEWVTVIGPFLLSYLYQLLKSFVFW